jgi:Abnormal spindle-like microcephaly-assoc'd, ASPM-SPD-2-Hydin
MRLPRTISRSGFSCALALIAIAISLPRAKAVTITSDDQLALQDGDSLVCIPAKLQFGKVAVGKTKAAPVAIMNVSSSSITLSRIIRTGDDFGISGLDFPLTLASGESFTFTGYFAPKYKGATTGSISFVGEDVGGSNPNLFLSGDGTDPGLLMIAPSTLDFGATQVGNEVFEVGYLMAGDSPVTVSSADSSSSEFILQDVSLPVTIPPGGVQPFTVAFQPQLSGPVAASLSFQSDAENSPTVQSLIGTGLGPGSHSVNLAWNPSISQNVVGYNVYRSLVSGGPYAQINTSLDPNTAFSDTAVSNGAIYYYVTTAVNSNNQESVYSNQAQASIPVN